MSLTFHDPQLQVLKACKRFQFFTYYVLVRKPLAGLTIRTLRYSGLLTVFLFIISSPTWSILHIYSSTSFLWAIFGRQPCHNFFINYIFWQYHGCHFWQLSKLPEFLCNFPHQKWLLNFMVTNIIKKKKTEFHCSVYFQTKNVIVHTWGICGGIILFKLFTFLNFKLKVIILCPTKYFVWNENREFPWLFSDNNTQNSLTFPSPSYNTVFFS